MSTRNNNFSNRNQKGTIIVLQGNTSLSNSSLILQSQYVDTSNRLSIGYIMVIVISIILVIGITIYYFRYNNQIRKSSHNFINNIKRSLADKV